MSTPVLASQMAPITEGVRAYFAPVDRNAGAPVIFDPAAEFDRDHPPSPWIDLGYVEHFLRASNTGVQAVRTGEWGTTAMQYRAELDAQVECEFRSWGKLQMALACGGAHYNVLASTGDVQSPSGGSAVLAVVAGEGSTATEIRLSEDGLAMFAAGDLVAVDADYNGEIGFIGNGISAQYVASTDAGLRDLDYVRRVTFNVGRVVGKTEAALLLAQPLPGGVPPANAGVQKVTGFVDREGGSFFHEWSALFVLPEVSGGRIFYYYPRLQSAAGSAEQEKEITPGIARMALKATLRALPVNDVLDGDVAVCYRSYRPHPSAFAY